MISPQESKSKNEGYNGKYPKDFLGKSVNHVLAKVDFQRWAHARTRLWNQRSLLGFQKLPKVEPHGSQLKPKCNHRIATKKNWWDSTFSSCEHRFQFVCTYYLYCIVIVSLCFWCFFNALINLYLPFCSFWFKVWVLTAGYLLKKRIMLFSLKFNSYRCSSCVFTGLSRSLTRNV